MSPLEQLRDNFDPVRLREARSLEMKVLLDRSKCFLPGECKQPGCKHDLCRELRNAELSADFCQFANADGGTILFGVRETDDGVRVEGLLEVAETRSQIESAIKATCSPVPFFETLEFTFEGKSLLAFFVPSSATPVWTKTHRQSLKIVRRIDETKMILDPQQTMEFVTDMSRSVQIRIKRIFQEAVPGALPLVDLAGGLVQFYDELVNAGGGWGGGGDPPTYFRIPYTSVQLTRCEPEEFHLQFWGVDQGDSNPTVRLPYSAIKHVWRTFDNRVGLVLDVRLTLEEGRIVAR